MMAFPRMAAPTPMATPCHRYRCFDPANAEDADRDSKKIIAIINVTVFFMFHPLCNAFYGLLPFR
jgi:hypothetical protein